MKQTNRDILSIAVPSIITNITTPLLALMDVVIVGHMGSADYIAAIAVGGTIFNMIYWLFAFLRMGSSGLTAQAHGANDRHGSDLVLLRGLLVVAVASVLMIGLQGLIFKLAVVLFEIETDLRAMVHQYFSILIWGAPASLGAFVVSGWFLGQKNAKAPMRVAFIINISNIVISLILVYGFGMKIAGVATGTLCAQWLGFIAALATAIRIHHPKLKNLNTILEPTELKRFFSINVNIFLRTVCLIAVTVWFTRIGSTQGTEILAVNTLLMQFFTLFSYFMDGFAFAGESLCGNFIGRKDRAGLHSTIKALFRWSVIMVALFTIIYAIGGEWLMSLLSDDPGIIVSSKEFFYWVVAIPAVGFAAFTWDGVFIGATRTREMLISIAISTVVYFLAYYFLFPLLGNHGLWIAFLAYLLTRGLILTLLRHRI